MQQQCGSETVKGVFLRGTPIEQSALRHAVDGRHGAENRRVDGGLDLIVAPEAAGQVLGQKSKPGPDDAAKQDRQREGELEVPVLGTLGR